MRALERTLDLRVTGLEDDPAHCQLAAEGGELFAGLAPPARIAPSRSPTSLPGRGAEPAKGSAPCRTARRARAFTSAPASAATSTAQL
jgi:hypothetical protein